MYFGFDKTGLACSQAFHSQLLWNLRRRNSKSTQEQPLLSQKMESESIHNKQLATFSLNTVPNCVWFHEIVSVAIDYFLFRFTLCDVYLNSTRILAISYIYLKLSINFVLFWISIQLIKNIESYKTLFVVFFCFNSFRDMR